MIFISNDLKKLEVFNRNYNWEFAENNIVKRIRYGEVKLVTCYYPPKNGNWVDEIRITVQKRNANRYYIICNLLRHQCIQRETAITWGAMNHAHSKYGIEWQFEIPSFIVMMLFFILTEEL